MSSVLQVAILMVCSLVAGLSSGLCGFGGSILFQSLWGALGSAGVSEAGDLRLSAATISVVSASYSLPVAFYSIFYPGKSDALPRIYIPIVPGVLSMIYLGALTLIEVDIDVLTKLLGASLIAFVIYRVWATSKEKILEAKAEDLGSSDEGSLSSQSLEICRKPATADGGSQDMSDAKQDVLHMGPAVEVVNIKRSIRPPEAGADSSRLRSDSLPEVSNSQDRHLSQSADRSLSRSADRSVSQSADRSPSRSASSELTASSAAHSDSSSENSRRTLSSTINSKLLYAWHTSINFLSINARTRFFWIMFATGMCSGFFHGLFSAPGPPIMAAFSLMAKEMSKSQIRATFITVLGIVFPYHFTVNILLGIYRSDEWVIYLLAPFFTWMGNWIGNYLHHRVNREVIMHIIILLMFISGIRLSDVGADNAFSWSVLAVSCLLAAVVVYMYFHVRHIKKSRVRPKVAEGTVSGHTSPAQENEV